MWKLKEGEYAEKTKQKKSALWLLTSVHMYFLKLWFYSHETAISNTNLRELKKKKKSILKVNHVESQSVLTVWKFENLMNLIISSWKTERRKKILKNRQTVTGRKIDDTSRKLD